MDCVCRALYPAPAVLSAVFELFELTLASTFAAFSDVPLSSLLDNSAPPAVCVFSYRDMQH